MSGILAPEDEAGLAQMVRETEWPLRVRGGGSYAVGGAGTVLSVAALSGITLYEPDALTMVARAGTPLAEIKAALAAEGQSLPWEPPDMRALTLASGAPTIGGVFATNASGPRRIVAGAARDFLLGVRFVDGRGEVVKNGGRVMKNVTGMDLTKLMAGAYGTLGVLTEVSFKVLPQPEQALTLALAGLDPAQAVKAMAAALGSPFGVTGAAHLPDAGETWLRLEGPAAALSRRAERVAALLHGLGAAHEIAGDWAAIRDARPLAGPGDIWRLSLTPTKSPEIIARLPEGARWFLDWGGARLWVTLAPGTCLRAVLGPIPGHATRLVGAGPGRFHPEAPGVAALTRALRTKFDPRSVLNRGMFD